MVSRMLLEILKAQYEDQLFNVTSSIVALLNSSEQAQVDRVPQLLITLEGLNTSKSSASWAL